MDYEQYQASIKAYKSGVIIHNDAVREWHEKYFDTAVSALSKMLVADHVKHSEDVEKFGADFASLVEIMDDATDDKNAIADELVAVDKEAKTKANAAIKKLGSMSHGINSKDEYMAAVSAYKNARLEHGEWKKHKYIRIENGRYIYPDENGGSKGSSNSTPIGTRLKIGAEKALEKKAEPFKQVGSSLLKSFGQYAKNRQAEDEKEKMARDRKATAEGIAKEHGVKVDKPVSEYKDAPVEEKKKSPKERIQSGEATLDDIRNEIKAKSKSVLDEANELAKNYAGGKASVEVLKTEPDTGAASHVVVKGSSGEVVFDSGDFLKEYDDWNYKTVKHSFSSPEEYRAAINAYKTAKCSVPR